MADMLAYAEGSGCRHVAIARHFDQTLESCGDACDRCLGTARIVPKGRTEAPTAADLPDVGRVILECCASLPFGLGRTGLAKVLTGAADSPLSRDRCAQFGVLAGFTLKVIRGFIDALVDRDLLSIDRTAEYPLISLTAAGRSSLRSEEILLSNPLRTSAKRTDRTYVVTESVPTPEGGSSAEDEDDRFERLRAWRRIESERQKVPPYVVFHDATLRMIAKLNPSELESFQAITGIGPRKIASYGASILQLLHGDGADS
jgi:ATP-dependent DNA helicase RecQ